VDSVWQTYERDDTARHLNPNPNPKVQNVSLTKVFALSTTHYQRGTDVASSFTTAWNRKGCAGNVKPLPERH